MESTFGANLQHKIPATVSVDIDIFYAHLPWMAEPQWPITQWFVFQAILNSSAVLPPTLNDAFVEELKSTGIPISFEAEDRVFRGHGKTGRHPAHKNIPSLSVYF